VCERSGFTLVEIPYYFNQQMKRVVEEILRHRPDLKAILIDRLKSEEMTQQLELSSETTLQYPFNSAKFQFVSIQSWIQVPMV